MLEQSPGISFGNLVVCFFESGVKIRSADLFYLGVSLKEAGENLNSITIETLKEQLGMD